jgi:hypothetical protein
VKLTEGERFTLIETGIGWDGVGLFKFDDPIMGEQLITDFDENMTSTIFYIGGFGYQLDYNGGPSLTRVELIAVPEPGALASLVGGMGMLLGLQRFRRWGAKR